MADRSVKIDVDVAAVDAIAQTKALSASFRSLAKSAVAVNAAEAKGVATTSASAKARSSAASATAKQATASAAGAAAANKASAAQAKAAATATKQAAAQAAAGAAAGRASAKQGALALATGNTATAQAKLTQATIGSTAALRGSAAAGVGSTKIMAGLGVAMLAAAAVSGVAFAKFDAQMSKLRAVSGEGAAAMDELAASAVEAGRTTAFSAVEAAQAQTELSKAGITTADILGGALAGSLSLAAAGSLDLKTAAETAAKAMNQFKIEGSEVERVADGLANGANKSAADVADLSQALAQGGLQAKLTGLSFEETVGALSAFSDNALQGSDAGTSLKTMLQRLTPQSNEAAEAMEKHGIAAYDAQGSFVGLAEFAGQLEEGLGSLTAEQRNAALATMFGSDATRAAAVMMELGKAGVEEYTAAISAQGTAQRVAAVQMDNLQGDVQKLASAFSTALVTSGEGANSTLRGLTKTVTGAINAFNALPGPIRDGAATFTLLGGAALLVGAGLSAVVTKAAATQASLASLGVSAKATAVSMGALASTLGVVGVAIAAVQVGQYLGKMSAADAATDKLAESLGNLKDAEAASGEFGKMLGLRGFWQDTNTAAEALDAFGSLAENYAGNGVWDRLERAWDFSGSAASRFEETLSQVDDTLAAMVAGGKADEAAAAYDRLMDSMDPATMDVSKVAANFDTYQASLDAAAAASDATAAGQDELAGAVDGTAASATDAADAVRDLQQSMVDAGMAQLSASAAAIQWQASIDEASASVSEHGRTLDITTAKGRANKTALDDMAQAALRDAEAQVKATGDTKRFAAAVAAARGPLIATARQMGMNEAQANAYADSVLAIPKQHNTNITVSGIDTATKSISRLRSDIASLKDRVVNVTVNTHAGKLVTTRGAGGVPMADGGVLTFANGGGYQPRAESHVAQIARPIAPYRVWAEPETGGEAYIPLSPAKRSASTRVLDTVADMFGYQLGPQLRPQSFADGGVTSTSIGSQHNGAAVQISVTADSKLASAFAKEQADVVRREIQDALMVLS